VTVIAFPSNTYTARLEAFVASGLDVRIAGTLDGFIDLAIIPADRPGLTYSLTCDDALLLIAALYSVVGDVREHCLYDRDPRLT
jgi:hypothetical protein